MNLRSMNIEAVAKAIEADAGQGLPDLRQALAEAKAGAFQPAHDGICDITNTASTELVGCARVTEVAITDWLAKRLRVTFNREPGSRPANLALSIFN